MEKTIWGVTSYDLGGNAGYVVEGIFTSKASAEAFAAYRPNDYEVEEFPLFEEAPPQWTYHTAITHVYPDGAMERGSFDEHTAEGIPNLAPLEDADVFDGHMQSHCGLHVYVCGTDKAQVRAKYRQLVKQAKAQSTGTCKCGRTELFQRDWMDDPLTDKQKAECAKTHGEGYCSFCGTFTVRMTVSSERDPA